MRSRGEGKKERGREGKRGKGGGGVAVQRFEGEIENNRLIVRCEERERQTE